jgi:uncharacterized protein (UPF0264 family)
VRNEAEALAALEGGASILDLKEPARGPLGPAAPAVRRRIAEIAARFRDGAGGLVITAAAGELADAGDPGGWEDDARITHVKLGLSLLAGTVWKAGLDRWIDGLAERGSRARVVAVAYADHERAGSPGTREVLAHAARRRLEFLLVDTFDKRGGSLRSIVRDDDLRGLIADAHEAGIRVAVAGSLGREDFEPILRLGADVVAVRGAACRGGREGEVDARKVADLASLVERARV